MLNRLTDIITGEPYLADVRGRQYRRVVCALAWPWHPLPGAVVALGEMRHPPTVLGEARHIHLLAEERSDSPAQLILTAERYLLRFKAPRIVTPEDDRRIALLDVENDKRRQERKSPLRTEPPLMWHGKGEGLLPYYLSLLQARVKDAKTLELGPDTGLPIEATQASAEDAMSGAMIQWPGVCALCWALEAIDMQPMGEWGGRLSGAGGPADALGGY